MNTVYIILLILAGLIALLLLVAAFLPGTYNVEKSIIINRPVSAVMNNVADLHHYANWNPWQKMEPGAKGVITGTPATPGHRYKWEGKKIGIGQLTLRDLDEKHVHFDLEFFKPFKSQANDNWLFEEWGNGETKVTWQNNGAFPWPMARLMGPMITGNLNKQFVEGLNNLKAMSEAG